MSENETPKEDKLPKGFGYWTNFSTEKEADDYCKERNEVVPYKEHIWRKINDKRYDVYIRDRSL